MGFFADFVMLYNIKPLSLHRVFHGIRFKAVSYTHLTLPTNSRV